MRGPRLPASCGTAGRWHPLHVTAYKGRPRARLLRSAARHAPQLARHQRTYIRHPLHIPAAAHPGFPACSQYLEQGCPAWPYGVLDNLWEVVEGHSSEKGGVVRGGLEWAVEPGTPWAFAWLTPVQPRWPACPAVRTACPPTRLACRQARARSRAGAAAAPLLQLLLPTYCRWLPCRMQTWCHPPTLSSTGRRSTPPLAPSALVLPCLWGSTWQR